MKEKAPYTPMMMQYLEIKGLSRCISILSPGRFL